MILWWGSQHLMNEIKFVDVLWWSTNLVWTTSIISSSMRLFFSATTWLQQTPIHWRLVQKCHSKFLFSWLSIATENWAPRISLRSNFSHCTNTSLYKYKKKGGKYLNMLKRSLILIFKKQSSVSLKINNECSYVQYVIR